VTIDAGVRARDQGPSAGDHRRHRRDLTIRGQTPFGRRITDRSVRRSPRPSGSDPGWSLAKKLVAGEVPDGSKVTIDAGGFELEIKVEAPKSASAAAK
jgi:hypothetical protein